MKNEQYNSKKVNIDSKSGQLLELLVREPETDTKGVVLINTGTCIPQQVYWKFADFLCRNNYISITYDYTDAQNFKSDVSHSIWIDDIESALSYVVETYPDLKKYCVGHSSGGQFLGFAPSSTKMDKLFLVASANGYWKNMNFPFYILMLLFWYLLVPFNVLINGYFNNQMYGVKGGFPKRIILELRRFCLTKDFFIPFFKSKNIPFYFDDIKCPVKAYHLADDSVATFKGCSYILNMYKNAQKSMETLHSKDYGIKAFGHRGFFFAKAEDKLWYKFLDELK